MSTEKIRAASVLLLGAVAAWFALDRPSMLGGFFDRTLSSFSACGDTYRVKPGDTLQKIAIRAYGTSDYRRIYEANRGNLTSAARLDVGDEILIPCRDDSPGQIAGPATAPAKKGTMIASLRRDGGPPRKATATAAAIVADPPPDDRPVRFLTGSDFAPFVHADLPGNGMATEIIRLAMASAAPGRDYRVILAEDWSSHLGLLADGSFDVGFPWYRPDCANRLRLSVTMRRRCARFDFSAPLFEVAVGYYARKGDPLTGAASHGALTGRQVCRPADHFTFDLEQEGHGRSGAILILPPRPDDCFALLDSGAVDVVSLSRPLAEAALLRLGLVGRVAEIPALASVQTLHAIAAKANPYGRAYLDMIDKGAADLHRNGRWFEVASHHLGAFGLPLQ